MEYLKNTRLNSVSLSLTLLTHSIAWTGVWKLDPVFSECLQNVNTHTHLPPNTHLFLSRSSSPNDCCGVCGPLDVSFLFSFFCLPPSHCLTLHSPAPGLPQGSGCEMHNQCNIHGLNYVFVLFFFPNKYCTACIFFFSFCVYFFFLPIYF